MSKKLRMNPKKINYSCININVKILFIILFTILLVFPLLPSFPSEKIDSYGDDISTINEPCKNESLLLTRSRAGSEAKLDFAPKEPVDSEDVNITIESIAGDEITWAVLYITLIKGGESRTGSYQFSPINNTKWFCIIPGSQNQGNTHVFFYADIYFDDMDITTAKYNYTVIYLNTWVSSVFSDNINLSYEPKQPTAGTPVNVTITSIDENTPIKLSYLRARIKLPGGSTEIEGGENFTRISPTKLFAVIPRYLGGSNVTFWVEAFDDELNKIVSGKYNYFIASTEDGLGAQDVIIYVFDDSKNEYVQNVPIMISNETWNYEITNHNGFAWPPFALNPGQYTIKVKAEGKEQLKRINLPIGEENYTEVWFHFNVAEAEGLLVDFEEFPQWFVNASFMVFIIAGPLFYYLYVELQKRLKQKEEESKKRMQIEQSSERSMMVRSNERLQKRTYHNKPGQEKPPKGFIMKDLWHPGMIINKILSDEEYKRSAITIFSFFMLGIFGSTWAPFYPWWMVIIIGIIIGAVSYRYPYLALLILTIFVIASTGYQHPAFGWLFMIFGLIIAICSLFDWRFGYIVFLTIFISRLGIAFIVPIMAGLLFSIFMGIAVAIASGIFFTFLVTSSDFTILSFFVGPTHRYGFISFSKPYVNDFMPTHFSDALGGINNADIDGISTILYSNYTSMIPFIQIIIWTVVVFVFVYIFRKYSDANIKKSLLLSLVPAAIIIITGTGSIFSYGHEININTWLLFIGIFGILFSMITFIFFSMELFREFYLGRTQKMPIGTRIGEMLSLRKTSFKEIGGLVNIKRELKDTMIGPLLQPKKAKEYGVELPRGIMLFGPPGCGKTMLMRALATELNVEMVGVRCSDVMSKWYGESEQMIEKLFQAVKARKPCILFLDEIDAIAKRRDFYSADDVTPRLLSIMLSELDGMDEASGVIVVGATNKPELVDPALMRPGRFDKVIFIPAPDYRSRVEIFKIHLKNKPVSTDLDVEHLARSTEGYTGADIENLVKESAMLAMKRSIKTRHSTKITNTDFLKILPRIKPSMTSDMKQEYDKLQQDFERKKYGKEIKLPPTEQAKAKKESRDKKPKKQYSTWRDIVGLDSSKKFFKTTIENNLKGGK